MSLLGNVVAALERAEIAHALSGAAALALHGVSRATADIDRFTVDECALNRELWSELERAGAELRLIKGDFEDPLAGSIRLSVRGDRTVEDAERIKARVNASVVRLPVESQVLWKRVLEEG